ncbi:transcriptional co-activator ADA2-A, putative, partial [Eimeria tenella]
YHCDVCGKDISGAFRIKCAECFDFDLCLSCFCSGRSSSSSSSSGKQQQHENSHAYIPVGRNTFPLFSLDWTAEEELLLIEGVGKYGFGNWAEVAELISQVSLEPKTAESCEKHYFNFYLNSAAAPLPDLSQLIKSKEGKALSAAEALERQHRARSSSSSSSSSSSNLPDAEAGQCAAGAATPAALPRPAAKPSHSIVGYWPLRGDFDVEFDNDAELILADMEFKGHVKRSS